MTAPQEEVLRLAAARDAHDFAGDPLTGPLLLDGWRDREFDPAVDSLSLHGGGRLIGYAAVFEPGAIVLVHPEHAEDAETPARLLAFTERRAAERDRASLLQRAGARDEALRRVLEASGYAKLRSILFLGVHLGAGSGPAARTEPPAGVVLEPIDPARDAAAVHHADALAFAGTPGHRPEPLQSFYDEHLAAPDFDPASSRLAKAGETAVGFVLCRRANGIGWVDVLGVIPDAQGRGIGRALLTAALEDFAAAGLREGRLDVDSDNPRARRLYASLGLELRHEAVIYEKALPPRP
jgi:mycothiol synthase